MPEIGDISTVRHHRPFAGLSFASMCKIGAKTASLSLLLIFALTRSHWEIEALRESIRQFYSAVSLSITLREI